MKIRLEKNESDMQKATRLLSGCSEAIPSVFSNAMNRAAEQGRTAAIRCVTKEYTVKAGKVRETMNIKRASKDSLNAELTSRGSSLPLRDFKYSPRVSDTTGAKRKQIRITVKRSEGVSNLQRTFVWKGHLFERLTTKKDPRKNKYPIRKLYSTDVPAMLNNDNVVDEVTKTMESAMSRRLDYEVRRTLNKAVK